MDSNIIIVNENKLLIDETDKEFFNLISDLLEI